MSFTDSTAAAPQNILFVLTDQQRTDTLGCYGNPHVRTPVLDGLAAQGTVFDRCFTPTAICTPARTSLLTGVMPFRHRLLANYERNVGYIETLTDESLTPFSVRLREAGYNVGLAGKWHVGRHEPAEFGFDGTHFPGWHNPVHHPKYVAWLAERGLSVSEVIDPVRGTFPNGKPGNLLAGRLDLPAEATFEAFLADEAIASLRRYADDFRSGARPFFLALHFFGPHLPYLLPASHLEMYPRELVRLPGSMIETFEGKPMVQRRYSEHWAVDTLSLDTWRWLIAAYWGYVTLIDEQLGRVLDVLAELELWDSTAVAFTADHGEFTGSHRLHDKGPAMYDDIYRIPAMLRVPGGVPGVRERRFTSLLDFTASVLELAGLPADPEAHGVSLVGLARGREPASWREVMTAEFHGHHFPYPQRMIRTEMTKLIVNPESVNELYDLRRDPDELTNVYEDPAYRAVRDALMQRLYGSLRERGDNFHHWMATMYPVGGPAYDASLSEFESGGEAAPGASS
jgi:arylsulfatase A-like enzyme